MEPLRVEFTVGCDASRAFSLWAEQTTRWWPHGHSVSAERGITVTFEPRPGGRIYERTRAGAEHDWGEVLVWEPPHRLVYLWHLRFDRSDATEVEVTFTPAADGTAVRIEHRGWERLGAVAEARRDRNRRGWAGVTPRFRAAAMLAAPVIADPGDEPHDGEEAWVVIEGELTVRVGDRELVLAAGDALHVPAGTPRTIRAADGARYVRACSG